MKYIILVTIPFFFINYNQCTKAQSKKNEYTHQTEISNTKNNISTSYIEKLVSFLASDQLKGRNTGSKGLEKAAKFIEEEFKKHGVAPYFDSYLNLFNAQGTETHNVVGYLKGTDPKLAHEYVIIGAHYDHIGTAKSIHGDTIANGANDNATGSAAVISLATYFATTKINKRSMLFILFSAEEKGLLGSEHISKVLKEKNIDLYTMINFEMIGVPLNNKEYTAYITGYEKSNMADKINEYTGSNLIGFLPKAKEFKLFSRSDNYPFFKEFNVPCQTISTFDFTNYDYYHHVDDEASKIDFEFMATFINNYLPAVATITNTPTKEIKLN